MQALTTPEIATVINDMNWVQKASMYGNAKRMQEINKLHDEILTASWVKHGEVVSVCGNIAIVHSENDPIYQFHVLIKTNDKWNRTGNVTKSLDESLLVGLGYKYNGCNSQFAPFAARMLDMDKKYIY